MKIHTISMMLVLATPLLRGDSCSPTLDDPSFELWCGDTLCAWTVEAGSVARVPTWHPADFGVELVGTEARISQALARDVQCLSVTTLADIAEDASLELAIDFYDDGIIDHRQPITGQNWARTSFAITPPPQYRGARVVVVKSGPGRAVLAELGVSSSAASACPAPPVELREGTLGTPCSRREACASRLCLPGIVRQEGSEVGLACGACDEDSDCLEGFVCGVRTDSGRLPYAACVPRAGDILGAACTQAAECSSGVCCGGTCSTCCPDGAACAGGETCGNGLAPENRLVFGTPDPAWRCSAGGGRRVAGDACTEDADCRSRVCQSNVTLSYCVGSGIDCEEGDGCGVCGTTAEPGVCQ